MTITELKQYIVDNDKIEYILFAISCHHITYQIKGYYSCANKDGDNHHAISVYNDENLKCFNYTRKMSDNKYADLITLVGFNMNLSFIDSVKYIHKLLGLTFSFNSKETTKVIIDPLEVFKKVKRKRRKLDNNNIEIHDESIIREYVPFPHIDWIREGIMPWTCEEFKIGYSYEKKRIIIPVRYWCGSENDYIGIIGRTTIKEHEALDIPKYLALKPFPKSMNLYGLQENYEGIQQAGYVVVAEAEKSTLKRHSRNDATVVSIGSHELSSEQIKILIGLNVEIVIAMDSDIDINHVRSMCDSFYGIREVSYIFDKYNLLKEKESPMDKPNNIYNYLFKYRVKYDERERREYLKWVDKQKNN